MAEKPKAKLKHVLVVDDNADLAQTYQELLQTFNYQATTAGNGVQALKFILENEVDAVVCDLGMPQLEGDMFYLAAQRVRPQLTRRFIFVTGNFENPKYEHFFKSVDCPVLFKPVSVDRLLETLKKVFGGPARKM